MANLMIVNPDNNVYLAVTDSPPQDGSIVYMLPIGTAETNVVSAFWTINAIQGGYQICLASNPFLCLDINVTSAQQVESGTGLNLSAPDLPNFYNSNLWIVGQLTNPSSFGIVSQIESVGTAGDYVVDAGQAPTSIVWVDKNNQNQNWQILSVQ